MSYEAAVAATGGDEYTIVKSFVIIARDITQSWYNNLPLGSIDLWGSLREKLCNNFKGINPSTNNPMELFTCTQSEREPPRLLTKVRSAQSQNHRHNRRCSNPSSNQRGKTRTMFLKAHKKATKNHR